MTVVVTLLPEPLPSREDDATFADRADAVMAQFNDTLTQLNAQNFENNTLNTAIIAMNFAMQDLTDEVTGNAANINTVSANIASVNAVAAVAAAVSAVAAIAANVTAVAANEANINAAVADLPALAAKVSQAQVLNYTFPAGTKMLFIQTAAPTGWTKDTTHNNKALRIVNGTATTGGTVAFTTAFASKAVAGTVGSTTLTEAQMPSHNHTMNTTWSDGGVNIDGAMIAKISGANQVVSNRVTQYTGGGTGHNHSFTGTAIDLAVQYVDTIIATKN